MCKRNEGGDYQMGLFMENMLLQFYRLIFILAEGIFLGIGVVFSGSFGFWILLAAGMITIIFWVITCVRRTKIVSKWSKEAEKDPLLAGLYKYETTMPSLGLTKFINVGLPVIFVIIWILLAVIVH